MTMLDRINQSELATDITLKFNEGKVSSFTVAQVKKIQRITFERLAEYSDSLILKMIRQYREKGK